MNAAELRAKVSKWGLAAVLAYGLFDGITYTTFFVLAFLSYEKSTGNNPATNLKALLGVSVFLITICMDLFVIRSWGVVLVKKCVYPPMWSVTA